MNAYVSWHLVACNLMLILKHSLNKEKIVEAALYQKADWTEITLAYLFFFVELQ